MNTVETVLAKKTGRHIPLGGFFRPSSIFEYNINVPNDLNAIANDILDWINQINNAKLSSSFVFEFADVAQYKLDYSKENIKISLPYLKDNAYTMQAILAKAICDILLRSESGVPDPDITDTSKAAMKATVKLGLGYLISRGAVALTYNQGLDVYLTDFTLDDYDEAKYKQQLKEFLAGLPENVEQVNSSKMDSEKPTNTKIPINAKTYSEKYGSPKLSNEQDVEAEHPKVLIAHDDRPFPVRALTTLSLIALAVLIYYLLS